MFLAARPVGRKLRSVLVTKSKRACRSLDLRPAVAWIGGHESGTFPCCGKRRIILVAFAPGTVRTARWVGHNLGREFESVHG
jgi:hypothetical protein